MSDVLEQASPGAAQVNDTEPGDPWVACESAADFLAEERGDESSDAAIADLAAGFASARDFLVWPGGRDVRIDGQKPLVRTAIQSPAVAAGAFAGKATLRTRDLEQARQALFGATEARVWCDGGCSPNPGQMGYGALIVAGTVRVELYGGGENGTCNIAELKAALMGLAVLPARCSVTMHADSRYTVDGITSWIKGWKKNGFKTKTGGPVKNRQLWTALDGLSVSRSIRWVWTRGHVGDVGNELADRLAALGRGGR
jgi:ribonuclease HI